MATVVKDLGAVTAYAYAVAGGYSGTEAEFEALLGNIAEDLSEIENLSVTVTTLPAGSSATASYSNGVLSLGIPKGDKGDKGDTGATGATGPTGNGISTITKTGTSGLVDTYTITFTNGDTTTFTVTNGEDGEVTTAQMNAAIETALEDYAKVDGSYSSLTAGNAEQLVSTVGVNDKTPYLFRTTGGSADVGDRVKVSEITGGTVAWNQLVNTGDTSVTVPNGHKYYSRINRVQTIGASTGAAISINDASEDNVFDLTAMFGSTIADYLFGLESGAAGAGVAKLKSWGFCTKPYYAYDAGSLLSVNSSAHKTVGFNQWDEEWEKGYYSESTGAKGTDNDDIRSKNYIPVLPSTAYHKTILAADKRLRVFYYDANKNYIDFNTNNATFTTPANCYYLTFCTMDSYGATYGNDICINLHWDGERDGEYEPYEANTYAIDDVELRGLPELDENNNLRYNGDVYTPDGNVSRNYTILENQTGAIGDTITLTGLDTSATDIVTSVGHLADVGTLSGTTLTLTRALSGADIVYPLATPTTESADPYQETQVCNDFGTEEFVDSRIVPMPVGANALYQANLRAKLEMAPDSPDGDGDYIVRQTDGLNEYVPLEKELPTAPAEDGTYSLKCTVADGTATLSWVSDT